MARNTRRVAKRANKPNPREDRNLPDFLIPSRQHAHDGELINLAEHRANKAKRQKRPELLPRNVSQEIYLEALSDPSKHIVFAMGPAGTGKTMLATQFAIRELMVGNIDKIIITRPQVSVDEQMGFLPGSLIEKMAPWCIPILDVFKETYPVKTLEKMIEEEIVEIAPLGFMRGRTLKNAIIIFDEAQNATPNQMKMMLTRIGEGSRIIVTGDIRQHDRGYEQNGLKDFVQRLRDNPSEAMAVVEFTTRDVERHPVIEDVLRLYGEG